jgi:hypothetical protein
MEASMDDDELERMPDMLTTIWMKAFEEKRFHDALMNAFANYLISREMKNEEFEQTVLISMKGAIERLLPPDGSDKEDQCSFCGRRPPAVRLAAGPDAFVCNECVTMLSQTFATST